MGIFDEDIETAIDKKIKERQQKPKIEPKREPTPTPIPTSPKPIPSSTPTKINIQDKKTLDINKALIFLTMLGVVSISLIYGIVENVSSGLGLVLLIIGAAGFLPLGLIVGKFFLDPYMRCKMLRKMRGKNYGLAYFIYKGGQRVNIRIKNFDSDIIAIENETKIWLLERGSIYSIEQDDNKIFQSRIEGNNVVTTPQEVPIVFLDTETMKPLSFNKELTHTNPQAAGAAILGYVNSKIAIDRYFRRKEDFFNLIMLLMNVLTFCGVFILYDALVGF